MIGGIQAGIDDPFMQKEGQPIPAQDTHSTRDQQLKVSASPFLTERDLAVRWQVSVRTLQRKRKAGCAPDYIRLNGLVRYPIAAVIAYEVRHMEEGET